MVETRGGRRFALLFLVAAFLVLVLGRWIKPIDDTVLMIAAPFEAAVGGAASAIGDTLTGVTQGPRLRTENASLKKEIGVLIRQNILLQQQARENALLSRMLRFSDLNNRLDLLPGRVIGTDPNSLTPYVIIDRGSRDGLRPGMTVLDQNGYFVGKITQLIPNASKVLLMINPSSSVGAIDLRSRASGLVEGQFSGRPQLKYVVTKSQLRPGDFVVTSGQLDLFPMNILLGQIVAVHRSSTSLFQTADLQPAANFENLELVQVVRNFVPSMPTKLLNP